MSESKTLAELMATIEARPAYNTADTVIVRMHGRDHRSLKSIDYLNDAEPKHPLSACGEIASTFGNPTVCLLVTHHSTALVLRASRSHHNHRLAAQWAIECLPLSEFLGWLLPPISPLCDSHLNAYGWTVLGFLNDPEEERPLDTAIHQKYEQFRDEIALLIDLSGQRRTPTRGHEAAGVQAVYDMLKR